MRSIVVALLVSLFSVSVAAQVPRPRFGEVSRGLSGIGFEVDKLVDRIATDTAVLRAMNRAHQELYHAQPENAIESALEHVSDVWDLARQDSNSDQTYLAVAEARARLLAARHGNYFFDMNVLREEIHHQTIHPLQRATLDNILELRTLLDQVRALEDKLDKHLSEAIMEAALASKEGFAIIKEQGEK